MISRSWKRVIYCASLTLGVVASPCLPGGGFFAPSQAQAQGETVPLKGRVLRVRSRTPVPGVVIKIEERGIIALGDNQGYFAFPEQEPGAVTLLIVAHGYDNMRIPLTVVAGEPIDLNIRLEPVAGANEAMIIVEREDTTEPVVRKITAEEIQRVPGSFGDAVRVVQNLPGVARSPFGLGFLIVRGTEPDDTGTYVDGIRVPLIFHFGGLTAIINTDMLENVTFLPGGFGTRYGRNLGGVVDVTTREIIPEVASGYADIDLIDTTLFYSRPLPNRGGLTFSVRRSYVDAVLRPILPKIIPEDSQASFQLPVYEDYQVLYDKTYGDHHRVHALLFGSRDRIALEGGTPPANADPLVVEGGNAGVTIINHKGLVRWTYLPTDRLSNKLTVGFGPDTNRINLGGFSIDTTSYSLFIRDDFALNVNPNLRIRAGVDGFVAWSTFAIELPFSLTTYELDPLEEPDADSLALKSFVISPSPYAEADLTLGSLTLTPGLRVDPYGIWDDVAEERRYEAATVDPRVSFRWRFSQKAALKGNIGRFANAPTPFAIYPAFGGDPDLDPEWALQASLGGSYQFTDRISLDGSVYRGELRDLIVATSENGELRFKPYGGGVNQGLELLLRHNPGTSGFFGWISYTLQKAERNDDFANACPRTGAEEGPEGCSQWYLFDFDQTHILTLVASKKLRKGWELGMRWRYTTGSPYTPLYPGYYDVDGDSYSAFSGEKNSLRYPAFHQLDVRVDKHFDVKWGELSAVLEVLNAYNQKNPEAIQYSYDYTETRFVAGLPVFPALGLKAEF